MMNMDDICTFVIPFRIECPERQRNLSFAIDWLAPLKAKIILLEADVESRVDKKCIHENVEYIFVEDSNPVFHRTHYINLLLKHEKTEIVSVWDTDVITSYQQIEESIRNVKDGCTLAIAYNGDCVMLTSDITDEFVKTCIFQAIQQPN